MKSGSLMKALLPLLCGCGCLSPSMAGPLSLSQATQQAHTYLRLINPSAATLDFRPTPQIPGRREYSWHWQGGTLSIDPATGLLTDYSNGLLWDACRQRYERHEAVSVNLAQATRRAQAWMRRVGLPVASSRFEKCRFDNSVGAWEMTLRRYAGPYRTPDYAHLGIDPYTGDVIHLIRDWKTPACPLGVRLSPGRASRLAVQGLIRQGRPERTEMRPPRLEVVRPNRIGRLQETVGLTLPEARLAWVISMKSLNGNDRAEAWIDAASGQWLGGQMTKPQASRRSKQAGAPTDF